MELYKYNGEIFGLIFLISCFALFSFNQYLDTGSRVDLACAWFNFVLLQIQVHALKLPENKSLQ
jgi:hypothetical protein